uniref:Uncharacterized protein n=1 Tax=Anguilla anguilla TaxID=7936 RepID=A0A0E9X4A2_ANGAN
MSEEYLHTFHFHFTLLFLCGLEGNFINTFFMYQMVVTLALKWSLGLYKGFESV